MTGRLRGVADAQKKVNEAMRDSALAQLEAESAEVQANVEELTRELARMSGIISFKAAGDVLGITSFGVNAWRSTAAGSEDAPVAGSPSPGDPVRSPLSLIAVRS